MIKRFWPFLWYSISVAVIHNKGFIFITLLYFGTIASLKYLDHVLNCILTASCMAHMEMRRFHAWVLEEQGRWWFLTPFRNMSLWAPSEAAHQVQLMRHIQFLKQFPPWVYKAFGLGFYKKEICMYIYKTMGQNKLNFKGGIKTECKWVTGFVQKQDSLYIISYYKITIKEI